MTIAAELDTLAARCRAAAPHPAHLAPRDGHREGWLDHLACALDDLAARVRCIEAQEVPVPPAAATGGRIVSLAAHRAGCPARGRVA